MLPFYYFLLALVYIGSFCLSDSFLAAYCKPAFWPNNVFITPVLSPESAFGYNISDPEIQCGVSLEEKEYENNLNQVEKKRWKHNCYYGKTQGKAIPSGWSSSTRCPLRAKTYWPPINRNQPRARVTNWTEEWNWRKKSNGGCCCVGGFLCFYCHVQCKQGSKFAVTSCFYSTQPQHRSLNVLWYQKMFT